MNSRSLAALLALTAAGTCSAFLPTPKTSVASRYRRQKVVRQIVDPEKSAWTYGEESRKYRRTAYTWDDWVKHRSTDRFFENLVNIPYSGLVRSILKEMAAIATISTIVILWNTLLVDGWTDLQGIEHAALAANAEEMPRLLIPLTPFTLSTSSLGLLLVFRSNNAYKRWDEARKAWGLTINHTRNLVRMSTAWTDPAYEPSLEKREAALKKVAKSTWAFARSQMRHISDPADEEDYCREIREKLPPEQAEGLIAATHRPNRAMTDLADAVSELPMSFLRKNEIDKDIQLFEDTCGSNERLFSSPIPLFYTRHTARFLSTWLVLMPLGIYDSFKGSWNHIALIPSSVFVALFMFGIEEIAIELEEPFSVLPLQGMCDKIGMNCDEIASWHSEVVEQDQENRYPYAG